MSMLLLCRYWDNPKVLEKLSGAMGDAFNPDAAEAGAPGEEEGEDGEEEPVDNSVHGAASSGDASARGTIARGLQHLSQHAVLVYNMRQTAVRSGTASPPELGAGCRRCCGFEAAP